MKGHPESVLLTPRVRFMKLSQLLSEARSAIMVAKAARVPTIWWNKNVHISEKMHGVMSKTLNQTLVSACTF